MRIRWTCPLIIFLAIAATFPPVASYAGEVSLTWTMPTTALDGTPLTDLAGAKVYYGVSSSNYTTVIDLGNTNACTVTDLQEGETYYFNGTAYNTSGLESDFCDEAVRIATSSAGNEPPQVNAGPDLTATLPNPLALNATVTDDGLPQDSALLVTWSKVQGPGTVTFANDYAIDTSATFGSSGTYTLRLQATDGEYTVADEISVTVSFSVVPPPPTNLLGEVSLTWTMPTTTLDGTPLTDLAGANVYYGVSSSNYTTVIDVGDTNAYTVTGLQEGETYYFNGTAYNTAGLESGFCSEAVRVAVLSSGNEPPQVNAGPDLTALLPNLLVLDATVTDDGLPQGSTLTVIWSKVQGPGTVTFSDDHAIDTSATLGSPGVYTLRLQAMDGDYTVDDELSVTVNPSPTPSSPRNLRIIP